jgi:hypothetical protein
MLGGKRPAFVLPLPDILTNLIHCFTKALVACIGEVDEKCRDLPNEIIAQPFSLDLFRVEKLCKQGVLVLESLYLSENNV